MITMYSTGCPRCLVLAQKLQNAGIDFELNTSVEEMTALGITQVPVLKIDDELLNFSEAIAWLRGKQ